MPSRLGNPGRGSVLRQRSGSGAQRLAPSVKCAPGRNAAERARELTQVSSKAIQSYAHGSRKRGEMWFCYARAAMRYESNPKHSEPWQRGRRGTLCPREVRPMAQTLLDASEKVGSKRYATHNGVAYCAQGNPADVWHGYPVGWKHVPNELRRAWQRSRQVTHRDISRHWD